MKKNIKIRKPNKEYILEKTRKRVAIAALSSMVGLTGCTPLFGSKNKNDEDLEDSVILTKPEELEEFENIDEDVQEEIDENVEEEQEDVQEKEEVKEEVIVEERNPWLDYFTEEEIAYFDSIDLSNYDGYSIVEALAQNGHPYSKDFRSKLAFYFGVVEKLEDYKGTSSQNIDLLDILAKRVLSLTLNKDNKNHSNTKKEVKEHIHHFGLQYYYVSNGNGTHHVANRCTDCGEVYESDTSYACEFGAWSYNAITNRDERTCASCGYVESRVHANEESQNQDDSNNKDDDNQKSDNKKHEHTYSKWKKLDDKYEYKKCSGCGKIQKRKHSFGEEQTKYEYLENGTHTLIREKKCTTCTHKKSEEVVEKCTQSAWSYNPETGLEESTCTKCKHVETRKHEHTEVADADKKIVQDYSKSGYHFLEYECSVCKEVIREEVQCVSNGKIYYSVENGVDMQYSICKDCHTVFNKQIHVHAFGEWEYDKDTKLEKRVCACGKIETREHVHEEVSTISIVKNLKMGVHNEEYTCPVCQELVSNEVLCTSDGEVYYEHEGEKILERTKCKVCHDIMTEKDHSHKTLLDLDKTTDEYEYYECACGEFEKRSHNYGNGVYDAEKQAIVYTCQNENCGHEKYMAHKTHDYEIDLTKTTDAYEYYECSCGEIEKRIHNYGAGVYDAENQVIVYTCENTNCGHEKHVAHKTHDYVINLDKTTDVYEYYECACGKFEKRTHNYGEGVYDAEKQAIVYTCQNEDCKHKKHVAHKTHDYEIDLNKTTDEYEYYECSCGEFEKRSHSYGDGVYDAEKQAIIYTCQNEDCKHEKHVAHKTHIYEIDLAKTTDEYEYYECLCGEFEERSHNYKDKYSYDYDENNKHIKTTTPTCQNTECNHTKASTTATEECTFGSWTPNPSTGQDERKCSGCGHVDNVRTHDWSEWQYDSNNNQDERTCSDCGAIDVRVHECSNFSAWSSVDNENEQRTCLDCGNSETRKHDYKVEVTYTLNDVNTHTKTTVRTCKNDGCDHSYPETETENCSPWVYDSTNGIDVKDCVCGKLTRPHVEECEHVPGSDWIYNSSTGKDEKKCSKCGEVVDTRDHEHVPGNDWVYNSSNGKDEKKCSKCNEVVDTRVHEHSWETAPGFNVQKAVKKMYGKETIDVCYYEDQLCPACKDTRQVPHEHIFETDSLDIESCSVCDLSKSFFTSSISNLKMIPMSNSIVLAKANRLALMNEKLRIKEIKHCSGLVCLESSDAASLDKEYVFKRDIRL